MTEPQNSASDFNASMYLQSGTNELDVLVFLLDGHPYGVNIAKVREIIPAPDFSFCPNQPNSMLGLINLRKKILPLVDLYACLDFESPSSEVADASSVIVMEFSGQQSAFRVDSIDQIFRSNWKHIFPIPDIRSIRDTLSTGIIDLDGRLVPMLDFESIWGLVNNSSKTEESQVTHEPQVDRENRHVVIVEDSNFSRTAMMKCLEKGGYGKINTYSNGEAAWHALQEMAESDAIPNVIVSDIEMPLLDGLTLTRKIKEQPKLKGVPVILFSSVITPDTLHKGKQVGADEQMAKPQLSELVHLIDRWCDQVSTATPSAA